MAQPIATVSSNDNCYTNFVVEKFLISWTIENFSFSLKKYNGTYFDSRVFSTDSVKSKWQLRLYPTGQHGNNVFAIYLISVNQHARLNVIYNIFIRTANDKILHDSGSKEHTLSEIFEIFVAKEEKPAFLEQLKDDKLVLTVDICYCMDVVESKESPSVTTENLQAKMCPQVNSMLEKKLFTDVTITVEGKELSSHQVILAAGSPVFEAMLQSDTLEGNTKRITITDFDFKTVNELVNFIYNRKSPAFHTFEAAIILNILKAADKYGIDDLVFLTVHYLILNLNTSNVVDVLLMADLLDIENLKQNAIEYIRASTTSFSMFGYYARLVNKPELMAELLGEKLTLN